MQRRVFLKSGILAGAALGLERGSLALAQVQQLGEDSGSLEERLVS